MYVTAHRAQTPDGRTGVNAYLFLHFADPLPTLAPGEPDVGYVSQFAAGTCVAEQEDLRPGGNTIECSLDVVGPDDAPDAAVRRVLEVLSDELATRLPPVRASAGGLAAALHATLQLDEDPGALTAVFDELSSRVVSMLARRSGAEPPLGPLVVWVQYRAKGIELSLPSATRARLGGGIAHRIRTLLPAEVVQHFPGRGPEALIEVAAALTGRSREQLERAGGLRFVDPTSESEVLRWPPDAAVPAEG